MINPELQAQARTQERVQRSVRGPGLPLLRTLYFFLALYLPGPAVQAGEAGVAALSQAEQIRLGERFYREGILPSGKPVQAVVKGDLAVGGRMFPCANCHRRSGLGSVEGGIITPANTGSKLFQPSYFGRELTPAERGALPEYYRTPARRPAYSEQTLAKAIRSGVDATGRVLDSAMPRYRLSDGEMAMLISYLQVLSAEPSPGVSETTLRFATVVTPEVPPRDRTAMLATLEALVADWNRQAPAHAERAKYPEFAQEADLSFRSISLARWVLEGPPASWRGQLEAYYRKEPVFALLGGISAADWKPIHDFSEEQRIPCLFPLTDFPVVSGSDWYTLYLSKGLYQEGEAAAGSLSRAREVTAQDTVVQVYRDTPQGRALAAGFEATWRSLGRKPPLSRILSAAGPIPADLIRQLSGKEMPPVLLLWLGNEAGSILERISEGEVRPKEVYLSASLLGSALGTLPEPVREFTSFTYPYRLSQDETMHPDYAKVWLRDRNLPVDERRISSRMYSLMLLLNQAIPKMKRNFYRDNLLDQVDLATLHGYPDFELLSFGPGERYASKACQVVTLSRGPNPILIKKSD